MVKELNKPAAKKDPSSVTRSDDVSPPATPKLSFGDRFAYSPAPEAKDQATIRDRYDLFIGGDWCVPNSGQYFATTNPATEEALAEVGFANSADVDAAVRAARKAYEEVWRPMAGRDRSRYLFRIARVIQERSRELAVLETRDGGKPIRESRDVDVPLAAAHFFYHAGWADKLGLAFPGCGNTAKGCRWAGDSLELPVADGGVEDRTGASLRQHGCDQAGGDDAADGAALGGDLPASRAAARRGERGDRRRHDGRRSGAT